MNKKIPIGVLLILSGFITIPIGIQILNYISIDTYFMSYVIVVLLMCITTFVGFLSGLYVISTNYIANQE